MWAGSSNFRIHHGDSEARRKAANQIEDKIVQWMLTMVNLKLLILHSLQFLSVSPWWGYSSFCTFLREGSSSCRFGPLPLNHSEPPCSRNVTGSDGSAPLVISKAFFVAFFDRKAASTRSGVNGASRRRTPTAS